jgi:hypothetical protein
MSGNMKQYLKRLITTLVGLSVLIIPPYLFGEWWLLASWLPAFLTVFYLDYE